MLCILLKEVNLPRGILAWIEVVCEWVVEVHEALVGWQDLALVIICLATHS